MLIVYSNLVNCEVRGAQPSAAVIGQRAGLHAGLQEQNTRAVAEDNFSTGRCQAERVLPGSSRPWGDREDKDLSSKRLLGAEILTLSTKACQCELSGRISIVRFLMYVPCKIPLLTRLSAPR